MDDPPSKSDASYVADIDALTDTLSENKPPCHCPRLVQPANCLFSFCWFLYSYEIMLSSYSPSCSCPYPSSSSAINRYEINHTTLAAYPSPRAMQHNADIVELLHKMRTLSILLEIEGKWKHNTTINHIWTQSCRGWGRVRQGQMTGQWWGRRQTKLYQSMYSNTNTKMTMRARVLIERGETDKCWWTKLRRWGDDGDD